MIQLVAALLLGLLMAAPALNSPQLGAAFPVYVHLLVLGWATQMIFGVAYWMFPRPGPEHGYGSAVLGWLSFAALNAGLVLRAAAEPAGAVHPTRLTAAGLLFAALLHLVAALAFTALVWRRVTTC